MADASERIKKHQDLQQQLEIAAEEARSMLAERRAVLDSPDTIAEEIVVRPGNALLRYSILTPGDSPTGGAEAAEIALGTPVLSSVTRGGPDLTVGSTVLELWMEL